MKSSMSEKEYALCKESISTFVMPRPLDTLKLLSIFHDTKLCRLVQDTAIVWASSIMKEFSSQEAFSGVQMLLGFSRLKTAPKENQQTLSITRKAGAERQRGLHVAMPHSAAMDTLGRGGYFKALRNLLPLNR